MAYSDSSSSDEDFVHCLKTATAAIMVNRKAKRRHRYWVSRHISFREESGEFVTLFNEMDDEVFRSYYRVSRLQFNDILSSIYGEIRKMDTTWRKAIPPEERLAVCLRFLATGDSFHTVSCNYRMGKDTVSRIVDEVCSAIWNSLQPKYMSEPTESDWLHISEKFEELWQFKNCLGAIDGKHCSIKCPSHSGSEFYNYKKFYSIVLLAVVDANRKFVVVDIGSKGRFSDGGIFADSVFGQRLRSNRLQIPPPRPLVPNGPPVPYVFIGDQGFPLLRNLLRPYSRSSVLESSEKRKFNYQLSRARNVVENAFGMLSVRFRIFRRPLECKVELAENIIRAACVLHNYLVDASTSLSLNDEEADSDQRFLLLQDVTDNVPIRPTRATREAFRIRDTFCEYFNRRNH